jgi:hypothetical protein
VTYLWDEYSLPPLATKCAEYEVAEFSRVVLLRSRCLVGRRSKPVVWKIKLYYWRKMYTWMARAVYKSSHLDPEAAYG